MTQAPFRPELDLPPADLPDDAPAHLPVLMVHGHFYQPAREDPFTGIVARDPSAAPAHDWNDRVAQEAYAPNATLGNFGRMGWDLGPTVARWLREHRPELHDAIWTQADADGAMAQGYHHAILPLASPRDRRTEIRWALRDVELRTGRRPSGIWLPETAVDRLTLRICAEEGVRWTILAPWQAALGTDVRRPHRIDLGDGLDIVVLFYDAELSTAVSFDAGATADADRFARELVGDRLQGGGAAIICTDGELYGHHQPFRDLFLERLLTDAALDGGYRVRTPGAWVASLDVSALPETRIEDRTSWSCHHGVGRWAAECGCARDGRWKAPLRQAFDRVAMAIDLVTEGRLGDLGIDTWAARDRYVDVASGFVAPDDWVTAELARAGVSEPGPEARDTLAALMRAQASRLAMFASCGWFWEDATRPEVAQVLRFAGHATRTVDRTCGTRLEDGLADELAAVPVGPQGSGRELYRAAMAAIGRSSALG
ncbi:MAG: DUF3536 domain-containing protein [Chloroflexi bacterium]|nr:DUF3536 domain-containing protein [Chloroflexota bacterium]